MIKRFILLPGLLLIIQFSQAIFADEETDIVAAESQREQASDDVHSATSPVGFATNASGQWTSHRQMMKKNQCGGTNFRYLPRKYSTWDLDFRNPTE